MAILQDKKGLTSLDLKKLRSIRSGMTVDLQIKTPTTTKRVRTESIGLDGVKYIIIKHPDEAKWGSLRDGVYTGNDLIVRFILEDSAGEVIAFKSKIESILTRPTPLIFLRFPTSIVNQGLRSDQRAEVRMPIQAISAGKSTAAMILDLSANGCRLMVTKGKGELSGDDVSFSISGEQDMVKGKIMNRKADESHHFYGIKFDQRYQMVEELLDDFLL